MGKVTAIIIGFISFLAVLASGNTGGAVIFGVAMFAMSYGAFAWRPGEQSKSPEDKVLDVKSSNLQTNSNKEDAKMITILSAAEQAAANSFALQFMEMGLEESEALKSANKIVTEVLAEFRPRGIDPFKSTQGNEYIAKETFTAPRLAAGLTMEDIRQHWNRPLLIIFTEVKVREMINFIYVDIARMRGRDLVEAGNEYKRNFPRYGDPKRWDPSDKFNQGLREQDADIYQEFAARVDLWKKRVDENACSEAIAKFGTLNAVIRSLAAANQLQ